MPRAVSPICIELNSEERSELERRARALVLPHRAVVRAKMVLMLADGATISGVARDLGQQRRIVCKWGERFVKKRLRGLDDLSGRGHRVSFSPGGRDASDQARMRAS